MRFGLTVFIARMCNLLAGLSMIGVVLAIAMHLAPPVVHSANGEARAYEAGWDLAAVLVGFAVVFWLVSRGLALIAARTLERQLDDEEDL
jgi:hypothetical protein